MVSSGQSSLCRPGLGQGMHHTNSVATLEGCTGLTIPSGPHH